MLGSFPLIENDKHQFFVVFQKFNLYYKRRADSLSVTHLQGCEFACAYVMHMRTFVFCVSKLPMIL